MSDDYDDQLRFVYAQLKALADDLPQIAFERDVERFHELIDLLKGLGFNADRFKLDLTKDMYYEVRTFNAFDPRDATYDEVAQALPGVFGRQVKALLSYFELTQNRASVRVGLPRG